MPTIFSIFPDQIVSNVMATTEESRSVRFSLMQFFSAIAPFILNSAACAFQFFLDGSVLHCEMFSSDSSEGFILDSRFYGFTFSSDELVGLNGPSNASLLSSHEIDLPKILDFSVKSRIFASFNISKKTSTSWPLCTLVYNFFAPFLFSLQLEDPIQIKIQVDTFAFGGDLIKWNLPLRIFELPKDFQMDVFDSLLINSDGTFTSLAASADIEKKVHVICLNGASMESEFEIVSFSKIKLVRKAAQKLELFSDLDALLGPSVQLEPVELKPAMPAPAMPAPAMPAPPLIVDDILSSKPIAKPKAKKLSKKRLAEALDLASDFIEPIVVPDIAEKQSDPWAIFSEDKIESHDIVSGQQPTLILSTLIEMKSNGSLDSIEVSNGLLVYPNIALPGSSDILSGPYNKSTVFEYIQKNGKNNLFKTQIAGGRGGNQKDITQKFSVVMRDLITFGKFGLTPTEVWKALEYHDKTHKKGILFAINVNKIKYSMSDLLAYVSSDSEPIIVFGQKKRRMRQDLSSLMSAVGAGASEAAGYGIGLDLGQEELFDACAPCDAAAEADDAALDEQKAAIKELFGDEFMDFGQAFGEL